MDTFQERAAKAAKEAEDDAMARSTKIYEARAKALANPKPVTKNKR